MIHARMTMPRSCIACQFYREWGAHYCTCFYDDDWNGGQECIEIDVSVTKPDWCPLELSPYAMDWIIDAVCDLCGMNGSGDDDYECSDIFVESVEYTNPPNENYIGGVVKFSIRGWYHDKDKDVFICPECWLDYRESLEEMEQ